MLASFSTREYHYQQSYIHIDIWVLLESIQKLKEKRMIETWPITNIIYICIYLHIYSHSHIYACVCIHIHIYTWNNNFTNRV